jgi:hypothetical protein
MDQKRRDEIVSILRDMVRDTGNRDPNPNKDMYNTLKKMIDNPRLLLDNDDEFSYDDTACLSRCNGSCCTDVDMIRVTPVDIDNMMESPVLPG